MTQSRRSRWMKAGSARRRALTPGVPTTSPTKKIRMATRSSLSPRQGDPEAAAGELPLRLRRQSIHPPRLLLLGTCGEALAEADGGVPGDVLDGEVAGVQAVDGSAVLAAFAEVAGVAARDLAELRLGDG